jgi:hypothetical protein
MIFHCARHMGRPRLRSRLRGKKTPRHDWSLLNLSLNLNLWNDRALREHRKSSAPITTLFLQFLFLFPHFVLRPLPKPDNIILMFDPNQCAHEQSKDKKLLSLFVHNRHNR